MGAPGLGQPVSTAEPVQPSLIVKPTLGPVVSTATVEAGCQALHLAVVPDTPGAPVRSGPGTSYEILGLLPPNQALSTIEISQNGEWLKIPFRDRTGWVFSGLVLLTDRLADTPGATIQGMSGVLEGTPFDQAKNLAAIRAYTAQPDLQLLFIRLEPTPEQSNLDQQSALYFDCNGKRYWVDLLTLIVQE